MLLHNIKSINKILCYFRNKRSTSLQRRHSSVHFTKNVGSHYLYQRHYRDRYLYAYNTNVIANVFFGATFKDD